MKKQIPQKPVSKNALIISRCLNCGQGSVWVDLFEIPSRHEESEFYQCRVCHHNDLRFYIGDRKKHFQRLQKGGEYKMVDKKPKAVEKKAKKTGPAKYGDDVKQKAVTLAKQGKTLVEIVKALNGPGAKATARYLKAANIEINRK